MVEEIKQRWFLEKYSLSITNDRRVFTQDMRECVEEVYQGRLVFRIPGTSKRVSRKFINRNASRQEKVLRHYVPF